MIRLSMGSAFALTAMPSLASAADCTPTAQQTEGPYWVDEMLNRSDIRSDPGTGEVQEGLPLRFSINVSGIENGVCRPMSGVWVDVWHCSATGIYSDVAQQGTLGQRFLRGYQLTDDHGNVRFFSVYPGWYPGRTIHIHYRVRRFVDGVAVVNFVSQLYFDQAITAAIHNEHQPYSGQGQPNQSNQNDGIYNSALEMRGSYNQSHVIANFDVVINASPEVAVAAPVTPHDPDSQDHLYDFGGGTPPQFAADFPAPTSLLRPLRALRS